MWILRILGPIKICKGPIKISNGPLKFENLHVFESDMGHWPILKAHHHFGLGLTLLFLMIIWMALKALWELAQPYKVRIFFACGSS